MTFSAFSSEHSNAPLVALHSSASSSSQWTQLIADLEGRFDVFAYDLPGYGRAPLARDTSVDWAASAALPVIAEIEKFGRSVHLVGHSNGGAIAIKVALLRPDLVKSLTVYEPATFHFLNGGTRTEQALYEQIQGISRSIAKAAMGDDASTGMRRFLDFWNGSGFWDGLPAAARRRFAELATSVMSDFASGFAETWQRADLAHLVMPVLVMTGLDSPEIAQHVSVAIAQAIPGARMALLPELGHMAPIRQPEWVNARIFEHVANAERPRAPCSWPNQVAA